MRRTILIAALAAAALAAPAGAGPSTGQGTIQGRIIDITCYGPCAPGTNPRPFGGDADVLVTDRETGEPIARVAAGKQGRYTVSVPPGRFQIVAIPYPMQDSTCWQGYPRRVAVEAGELKRRRLLVENVCVQ